MLPHEVNHSKEIEKVDPSQPDQLWSGSSPNSEGAKPFIFFPEEARARIIRVVYAYDCKQSLEFDELEIVRINLMNKKGKANWEMQFVPWILELNGFVDSSTTR